eukprot:scaffold18809_cov67-Phaeocystis_antarctica.AAC.2
MDQGRVHRPEHGSASRSAAARRYRRSRATGGQRNAGELACDECAVVDRLARAALELERHRLRLARVGDERHLRARHHDVAHRRVVDAERELIRDEGGGFVCDVEAAQRGLGSVPERRNQAKPEDEQQHQQNSHHRL